MHSAAALRKPSAESMSRAACSISGRSVSTRQRPARTIAAGCTRRHPATLKPAGEGWPADRPPGTVLCRRKLPAIAFNARARSGGLDLTIESSSSDFSRSGPPISASSTTAPSCDSPASFPPRTSAYNDSSTFGVPSARHSAARPLQELVVECKAAPPRTPAASPRRGAAPSPG